MIFWCVGATAQGTVSQTSNFVQNGSFEVITVVPGVETRARPWFGHDFWYSENWRNAPDGRNYANVAEDVYQDIAVNEGALYSLTFWVAGDLLSSQPEEILVKWGNQDAGMFVTAAHPYDPQVNRQDQIVWQQFEVENLLANNSIERLEFQLTTGGNFYLDGVTLLQVPEPTMAVVFTTGLFLLLLLNRVKK